MAKRSIFEPRDTRVARDLQGGCFDCHGYDAVWFGPNAQGVAARHHDATGHSTWVDVMLMIRYGEREATNLAPEPVQNPSTPLPGPPFEQ